MIFSSGRCKKSGGENWNRDIRIRIYFQTYERWRHQDFRCGTIPELYCANTVSDLLGCKSCDLVRNCCYNVNLFTTSVFKYHWWGRVRVLNSDWKEIGSLNLATPGNSISCDAFGALMGRIPDGEINLDFILYEPCFGTTCRPIKDRKSFPRTLWRFVIKVPAGNPQFIEDYYLDETIHGSNEDTRGLCY